MWICLQQEAADLFTFAKQILNGKLPSSDTNAWMDEWIASLISELHSQVLGNNFNCKEALSNWQNFLSQLTTCSTVWQPGHLGNLNDLNLFYANPIPKLMSKFSINSWMQGQKLTTLSE